MTLYQRIHMWVRLKLWARWRANYFPSFHLSHSQYGEDMIVRGLFGTQRHGTFVDIGAHHPTSYSNTYHFYCSGWRGINIDAMPGSMEAFKLIRPLDTNLELCMSDVPDQDVTFYLFGKGSAINTIDPDMAAEHERTYGVPVLERKTMRTQTLAKVLEQYLTSDNIDLLTIDVEGMDEKILRSNDWKKYRPKVVIFERHDRNLQNFLEDNLISFMVDNGYSLCGMCGPSFVMKRNDWTPAQK